MDDKIDKNLDDSQLIAQYINGDKKSLEVLIKKYLNPIYGFVYKNVGDKPAAEDITQEVFIKVWKNIKKFDQKREFKPWIFQIAKNTSIDYLRKKKTIPFSRFENEKGQNVLLENIAPESQNIVELLNNKRVVQLALETLSAEDKNIINLRHTDGMSFKEISETLEKSINTVKSRYRRIIANLKKVV
jgi:RNA polymerase sigma-70 factor (ECF subfamily)